MKTFFTILTTFFILWSCNNRDETCPTPEGPETSTAQIELYFSGTDSPIFKAFGGNAATVAEKRIQTAKLFIFKSGTKIFEKYLDPGEITNITTSPIKFTVPGMTASTSYDYYLIANNGNITAANLTALQAITQTDITSYNGAWNTVNDTVTIPKRSGGFVMEGKTTAPTTNDLTQTQSVAIILKRITAKLDVKATIDNTKFGSDKLYEGTLSLDSTFITKTQTSTPIVPGIPTTTAGTQALGKQIPNPAPVNSIYQNRFYVFENGALGAGSQVVLTLYATYTNGGTSTPLSYTTELSTDNSGAIVRNGSYAINLTISGLAGTPLSVSITVSDWESVITQTGSLGN